MLAVVPIAIGIRWSSRPTARFKHPEVEAIARIVKRRGARLHFNYRTKLNEMWDDEALERQHGYAANFPASADKPGIVIEVHAPELA